MRIRISWPGGQLTATLDDTPTSAALAGALPIVSTARTWGEEVYFETPLSPALEAGAREVVEPGTVAFWTEGGALALPYGPTPVSRGDECRLASACNIVGRLDGDPRLLATVRTGDRIRVDHLQDLHGTRPRPRRPPGSDARRAPDAAAGPAQQS